MSNMKALVGRFKLLPLPARIGIAAFAALFLIALFAGITRNVMRSSQQPQPAASTTPPQPPSLPQQSALQPAAQTPEVKPTVVTSAAALPLDAPMKANGIHRTLIVRSELKPDIEIERSVLKRTSFNADSDSGIVSAASLNLSTWLVAKHKAYMRVEKVEKVALSVTTESDSDHALTLRVNGRKTAESRAEWFPTAGRYGGALLAEEKLAVGYHEIEVEVSQSEKRPVFVRVAVKPESEAAFRDFVPHLGAESGGQQ